jgi:hypothetical protein
MERWLATGPMEMKDLLDPSGIFHSNWNPKIFERLRPSWE